MQLSDLAARVDAASSYIAFDDSEPVGTFALDWTADPEFWQVERASSDAGYLHRLAVARTRCPQGIGAQFVEHAANLVARNDRRSLRLDCGKDNTRLHAYYRQLGFKHVDTIDFPTASLVPSSSGRLRPNERLSLLVERSAWRDGARVERWSGSTASRTRSPRRRSGCVVTTSPGPPLSHDF